jgi:hypothetical protein
MKMLAVGFSNDPMQQYEAQHPDLASVIANPSPLQTLTTSAGGGAGAAGALPVGSSGSVPVTKLQYYASTPASSSGAVGDQNAGSSKGASPNRGGVDEEDDEEEEEEDEGRCGGSEATSRISES